VGRAGPAGQLAGRAKFSYLIAEYPVLKSSCYFLNSFFNTNSYPFMRQLLSYQNFLALLLGGLLLGACGGNSNTTTSTPTSMLGTKSAATKVGGTSADTAATTTTMGVPAGRTVTTPANTMGTGH